MRAQVADRNAHHRPDLLGDLRREAAGPGDAGTAGARSESGTRLSRGALRFGKLRDDFRIKRAFGNLDSGVQRFRGIAWQDRDLSLRDDLATVDTRIHIVNGAARNFFSSLERLLPGLDAGKFREQ